MHFFECLSLLFLIKSEKFALLLRIELPYQFRCKLLTLFKSVDANSVITSEPTMT